jgi:hypothetical protein
MSFDREEMQPGLSAQQYEELVHFLMTWAGLTRREAEDRAAGRLHPGQITRSMKSPVRRPIYPPNVQPAAQPLSSDPQPRCKVASTGLHYAP